MFRKKQSEFQYAPGIEKIIEDIRAVELLPARN